ncbi:MAG: hypothetical protein HQ592_14850, partial [Planctomycetes bacterium]|nr:hypothetical protein [Planctomycetota bacterium]
LGTHRAHHQFLAKVLSHALPETWNPVDEDLPGPGQVVVERTMAEIMGLADGYCGGRGGSMHLRNVEAGFLGSNAIVAGGIPIATGVAFAEKFNKTGNVVVCFFGDGATNQGSFHEACNLAGLWNLPLIMFLENNKFAVATPTKHACAIEDLAIRASSYGMNGHIVDGNDPAAIYSLVGHAADEIRNGGRPCLIEARCYRRYHHAGDRPGSAYGYRSQEEEAPRRMEEVTEKFPRDLVAANLLTAAQVDRLRQMAAHSVSLAAGKLTVPGSPRKARPELFPAAETVTDGARSDGQEWASITFSRREQFGAFTQMHYSDAIAAVTQRWMERNAQVFVLGEEVANFGGGAYGATKGLPQQYPERVLNTPISEAGFVGLGLGAAMMGMQPIVEIMFADFSLVAADQLFNQIGKARHMYGNTTDVPLVVRTRVCTGLGYGGQHSMHPVGLFALFSGWRIVAPADAIDYVGLFNSAMCSLDPVLIIEHQALYDQEMPVPAGDLDYFIELRKARAVASGSDVTLLAYSSLVPRCRKLLPQLAAEGVSAELIDLRTLDYAGIDYGAIGRSLRKTGAVVIVEEALRSQSIGPTVAANITERFFDYLDGPVACMASEDVPPPVSRVLEAAALIKDDDIMSTAVAVARRQWR